MPNDARLGLAVGVALVILVAVFLFHRDSSASPSPPAATILREEDPSSPEPTTAERKKPTGKPSGREVKVPALLSAAINKE